VSTGNAVSGLKGKGTFRGSENSSPTVGEKEKFEVVDEVKLEVVAENWKIGRITEAIKRVHPYEEPAFDIYPLVNSNVNYGAGAVGELGSPLKADEFLKYVSERLGIKNFRYSGYSDKEIKKAAVCGGSGSEHINDAIRAGADVYITADIKYHAFQQAEGKILLIDAGHFETEIFLLDAVERYLGQFFNDLEIIKFTGSQNPVVFYNNQGAI
jgi:putative NIF3 family GTP cyclohydrolase 1 type 2